MDYLTQLKKALLNEKEKLKNSVDREKVIRDSSPSAMQSHHDTTRNQTEKLIHELELQLKDLEKIYNRLPDSLPNNKEVLSLWNLADINIGNNKLSVMLVPAGLGGKKLDNLLTLAENSPLGITVKDKPTHFKFEINGSPGEITKIF